MSYRSYGSARSYYGGWAPYVPVAERRAKAEREMAKLAKKGQTVSPVKLTGTKIATTFWGKAWCDNLESYGDYANRLPRGRTYVRNGSVVDLQISPLEIRASVAGSSVYKVAVRIVALPPARWKTTCRDCTGGIDSLVELLQGRFSKGVMERICRQDQGLFPKPSEIDFTCSCPDSAGMCKHIAAVLYGVGARLDEKPELLFRLRAVDEKDLVTQLDTALPLAKSGPAKGRILAEDDVSALFGLDMDQGADVAASVKPKQAIVSDRTGAKPKVTAAPGKTVTAVKPVTAKPSVGKPLPGKTSLGQIPSGRSAPTKILSGTSPSGISVAVTSRTSRSGKTPPVNIQTVRTPSAPAPAARSSSGKSASRIASSSQRSADQTRPIGTTAKKSAARPAKSDTAAKSHDAIVKALVKALRDAPTKKAAKRSAQTKSRLLAAE